MQVFRYPRGSLIGDYLRSGGGLAAGAGGLALAPGSTVVLIVCGSLIGLFGWFALRTYRRGRTEIALSEQGIACRDLGERRIAWSELSDFKLRFYGTRRQHQNREGGFMMLTLKGPGAKIEIESNLNGFTDVAEQAAVAAGQAKLEIDAASAGYLLDLGIEPGEPGASQMPQGAFPRNGEA